MTRLKIVISSLLLVAANFAPGQPALVPPPATLHFAGASRLADNPDFANLKTMLTLQSSLDFRSLALGRTSAWLARSFEWGAGAETSAQIRPLLDDLLSEETYWAFGGSERGPLNFIAAIRSDDKRSLDWQQHLRKVLHGDGESFKAQASSGESFSGERWKQPGGKTFWFMRVQNWILVGRGDELTPWRSEFLAELARHKVPDASSNTNCLEADLDWPRLMHWLPDAPLPFKPARTKITLSIGTNQLLTLKASVHYPQPIPWKPEPWRVPTDLIRDPLVSFTTGQDIAAYMTPDGILSRLTDNPLTGQYYVWALNSQIGFQSYAAWPVADSTNTLRRLADQATNAFNPDLEKLMAGKLQWRDDRNALVWSALAPMIVPQLEVAPETNGQYLLASFFPLDTDAKPAPAALFRQFLGRTNLVYYDWEGTGPRLDQWRLLASALPIFPRFVIQSDEVPAANKPASTPPAKSPILIEENWLVGLKPMLFKNTITEITRVAPDELSVIRKSPLGVTALELVVFSHWLSGTGSTGLLPGLLPPRAKETGIGVPPSP